MIQKYTLIFLCSINTMIFAGESLSVMQYNLLNYGASGGTCPSISEKNSYLKKIIKLKNPDVLAVNELLRNIQGGQNTYAKNILDNVLNTDGITHYKRVPDSGNSSHVNMLYYNSNKLTFVKQDSVYQDINGINLVRIIDIYTFYYSNEFKGNDTVFIDFIVGHLKAGNNPVDITDRSLSTQALMNYLDDKSTNSNRIFMGDFNFKGASEEGFSNLIYHPNVDIRFNDPIFQTGEWNNNPLYAKTHTQSTHTDVGCYSSGGMDDRFDFILISNHILLNYQGIVYVNNSYEAVGQDGSFLDSPFPLSGTSKVSPEIAEALYWMSDHLPVYLELWIDPQTLDVSQNNSKSTQFYIVNPTSNVLTVKSLKEVDKSYLIKIFNTNGEFMSQEHLTLNNLYFNKDIQSLNSGMYIIEISAINDSNTAKEYFKIIKL